MRGVVMAHTLLTDLPNIYITAARDSLGKTMIPFQLHFQGVSLRRNRHQQIPYVCSTISTTARNSLAKTFQLRLHTTSTASPIPGAIDLWMQYQVHHIVHILVHTTVTVPEGLHLLCCTVSPGLTASPHPVPLHPTNFRLIWNYHKYQPQIEH